MCDRMVLFREILEHWRAVFVLFEAERTGAAGLLLEVFFHKENVALDYVSDRCTYSSPPSLIRRLFRFVSRRSDRLVIKLAGASVSR